MAPLLLAVLLSLGGLARAEEPVDPALIAGLDAVLERAQDLKPGPPCPALGTLGCFFTPPGLEGKEPALLIYFRGFWTGHGDGRVPERERAASARQALTYYDLAATAEQAGAVVLVTGSSDAAVREADIAAVGAALGLSFKKVYLAAHSGGYTGLLKSLPGLRRPDRLVMLDDFYFTDAGAVQLLQDRVAAGTLCSGFFTSHNEGRWNSAFRGRLDCAVENRDDLGHTDGVRVCLGPYLTTGRCL